MKFLWFEPSTRKAIKILFKEFTPEERAILNGENCVVPHMYSQLLKESSRLKSFNWDLETAKRVMKVFFFAEGNRSDVRDPEVQKDIYLLFEGFVYC